ncbi:hypothetical protein [Flavobacterium sp.]|jgi:hypothetical protein|uniref:hypothetical protein n=1 Tax=Flavobacterium sp. TaxID=239 RepID=UPI00391B082D
MQHPDASRQGISSTLGKDGTLWSRVSLTKSAGKQVKNPINTLQKKEETISSSKSL